MYVQSAIFRDPNASFVINSSIMPASNVNNHLRQPLQRDKCLKQLKLIYDEKNEKDVNQIVEILTKYLNYPSSKLAQLHMQANILGKLDLINRQQQKLQMIKNYEQICNCCGFVRQNQNINLCENIENIIPIGVSTYLFFLTFKHIILLMVTMFFVFSIYAIVSNIVASEVYKNSINNPDTISNSLVSYQSFLIISLGSKQINQSQGDRISYNIQCWLGVALIFIWFLLFFFIKYRERIQSAKVSRPSKRVSTYSIVIKNFPKMMTKKQLEQQLIQFYSSRPSTGSSLQQQYGNIKVVKINKAIPFYLDSEKIKNQEARNINRQYKRYKKTFISWILQRRKFNQFQTPLQQRNKIKQQFILLKQRRIKVYHELANIIKNEVQRKNEISWQTVPTFVTFNSSLTSKSLIAIHDQINPIFDICFSKKKKQQKYFHITVPGTNKTTLAQISRAPQPQDIYWRNLGQNFWLLARKKLLIYFITILVLGGSFGAVYGLSKVQDDYKDISQQNDDTNKNYKIQYISVLISLVIGIVNVIIQQILRFLTKMQRNVTRSQIQINFAFKGTLALLINSIVIPILVSYFFKDKNLYGINGLAYDIFYLGIINSFLYPIIRIFDIEYVFFRLVKKFQNSPTRKLHINQNTLNYFTEHIQFQIGYEHIYINNLFLFTCFFSPLQPIIVLFAIAGLSFMYWVQKNSLYHRSKGPVPGNNFVNTSMFQILYFGPTFYTIGSFCWSHFFKQSFIAIAPNLVAAIFSLIVLVVPYNKLVKKFLVKKQKKESLYQQNYLFFDSEYDRLNPATSYIAIQLFKRQLANKKQQLGRKSFDQVQKFEKQVRRYKRISSKQLQQKLIQESHIDNLNDDQIDQILMKKSFFQFKKERLDVGERQSFNQSTNSHHYNINPLANSAYVEPVYPNPNTPHMDNQNNKPKQPAIKTETQKPINNIDMQSHRGNSNINQKQSGQIVRNQSLRSNDNLNQNTTTNLRGSQISNKGNLKQSSRVYRSNYNYYKNKYLGLQQDNNTQSNNNNDNQSGLS